MIIDIKQRLIQEGVIDGIKRHKGKIALGAGLGIGAGIIHNMQGDSTEPQEPVVAEQEKETDYTDIGKKVLLTGGILAGGKMALTHRNGIGRAVDKGLDATGKGFEAAGRGFDAAGRGIYSTGQSAKAGLNAAGNEVSQGVKNYVAEEKRKEQPVPVMGTTMPIRQTIPLQSVTGNVETPKSAAAVQAAQRTPTRIVKIDPKPIVKGIRKPVIIKPRRPIAPRR